MVRGPHLYRRGPVYYWQRRLPASWASHLSLSSIRLNLRTKDVGEARRLVAALDAVAMEVFVTMPSHLMTKKQLQALFKRVFIAHQSKLSLIADFERQDPAMDRSDLLALELAMGEAYKLLAEQGAQATLNSLKRQQYLDQNSGAEFIAKIEQQLRALREVDGGIKLSLANLKAHIEAVGSTPKAANIALAQPIYLRAMAAALLQAEARYGDERDLGLDFDVLIKEALLPDIAPEGEVPNTPNIDTTPNTRSEASPSGDDNGEECVEPSRDGEISVLAEKLSNVRKQDKSWDDKTVRQALYIYGLFARFMEEEFGLNSLAAVEQRHVSQFDGFLRGLHSNFGKSSKDPSRTIAEIRKLAAENAGKSGLLSGVTRNRHWMFIGQLLAYGRGQGHKIDRDLSTAVFHAPKKTRGRNQRAVPAPTNVQAFFHVPVFNGYARWDDIDKPGTEFYHRAEFFCSIIAYYSGGRREEYCGLTVDDVVTDNGEHPYVHIAPNEVRRIKNEQSQRNLALHPELIRLGFLDYVSAVKSLGYTRLFPDLHSPSSKSPLGDRLYDQLLPSLRKVGFTPHQMRHFFGDDLKQNKVHAEHRADLMGHGGDSETTERYCNPLQIGLQLEHIVKLPVFTAHLHPRPIKLLPWVEAREIAPWSKAAKQQRKEAKLAAREASGKPPRRRHKRRKPES